MNARDQSDAWAARAMAAGLPSLAALIGDHFEQLDSVLNEFCGSTAEHVKAHAEAAALYEAVLDEVVSDERLAGRLDMAIEMGSIRLAKLLEEAEAVPNDEAAAMLRGVIEAHDAHFDKRWAKAVASECHGCDAHTIRCGSPDYCCAACPDNPEETPR